MQLILNDMIRTDLYFCRTRKRNEIAKEGIRSHTFFALIEYPPLKLLLSLFYYYYMIYVFFTCAASCLGESNDLSGKLIFGLRGEKLLLENVELKFLLGHFYMILFTFIIRKSISEPPLRNRALLKLRIGKSTSKLHRSRLTNLVHALCLWSLVLNFLLIAMCNPSMKNPGPQTIQNLSVFYCNVQGLIPFGELASENPMLNISKLHELNHLISDQKPDIIIYNETWLKGSILDNEVIPTDTYKVFRLDRSSYTHPPDPTNNRKFRVNGGGVLIAIKHSLDIESKEIPVKCKAEILSIELTDKVGKKSIISSFYRVGTLGEDNHSSVSQYLHTIRRRRQVQNLTLVGDLNLPHACWENSSSPLQVEQSFIDTFNDLSLKQLVAVPTHIKGNILDNILTDKPDLITNIRVDSMHSPCGSDHFPIFFKLKLNAKRKKACKRKIYNFKRADWARINNELSMKEWDLLFRNRSATESWQIFKENLFSTCDKHIPKIVVPDEFQPPWFDSEVFNLCRKKERLHQRWKETNSDEKYFKYSRARSDYKNLVNSKMEANFEDPYNRNLIN